MGDDMKKVRSGDPLRIPAATYNRLIDTARAQAQSGPVLSAPSARLSERDNVKMCWCAWQGQAPRPWPPKVLPPKIPVRVYGHTQFERLQCYAPSDMQYYVHQHGITLEPIHFGNYGPVAISGGPYKCRVVEPTEDDDVQTGTRLGVSIEGGVWALKKSTSGHFTAITPAIEDPEDGNLYSWVVIGSAGSTTLYGRATVDMLSYQQKHPVELARGGYGWSGETVDCYPMYRRVVPAGTHGIIAFDYIGEMVFFDTTVVLPYVDQDPQNVPSGFMWLRSDL